MRDSAPSPRLGRRALLAGAAASLAPTGPAPAAAAARPAPAAADDRLPPALRRLVLSAGLPTSSIGLHIEPLAADAPPLAGLNPERPYQLASTAKVVTTLAALALLGPTYRWRTPAFTIGPLHDGRLDGDLLILGGGDALLRTEDLLAWFRRMHDEVLREVRGNIVLDRFAFRLTEADLATTPPPGPDRPHHVWPDALTLDEGRLKVRVQARPGMRPALSLAPAVSGLRIDADLAGQGGACELSAEVVPPPPGQAASRLMVRGRWPAHCGSRELELAPWSHEVFTLRAVGALWRESGGRLRGRVVAAPRPPPARGQDSPWPVGPDGRPLQAFSLHRSEPLPLLVRDINKTSDNLAARNLMLSLAPGFPLRAATLQGARERVHGWLRSQGLAPGDIQVDSGSGLSREERGKPRALAQLLRQAWHSPQRDAFVASLPVAGVDGTLANRLTRGRATGRAFLKTGTLLDTRGIAGYVLGASGQPYALVALVNHAEAQRATPMFDHLVEWLASQA